MARNRMERGHSTMSKATMLMAMVKAGNAEERRAALEGFENAHGSALELDVEGGLDALIRAELGAEQNPLLLAAYREARLRYQAYLERGGDFDWQSPESRFHMTLLSMVDRIEGDLESCRQLIEQLLESGDAEQMGVASRLLEKMGASSGASWPALLRVMEQHGVNEMPFRVGRAAADWIRQDLGRLNELDAHLRGGGEKVRQALCFVLGELGKQAASKVDLLLELIEDEARDPETRSCAFIALAALGTSSPEISEVVARGLRSPHWFIRGNASSAAGALGLDPDRFVPLLVERLDDQEGFDWVPAEKALGALCSYGVAAAAAIPALEARLAALQDSESWDDEWIYPDELEVAVAILSGEEPPDS